MVDRATDQAVRLEVDARALGPRAVAEAVTLTHADPYATNSQAHPDRVAPASLREVDVDAGTVRAALPPVSWSMVRLTRWIWDEGARMREARLHAIGDLRLSQAERPAPGPGESLLRVTAVGLCGSDLHWFAEGSIGDSRLDRPLVLGHEFGGVVEGGPLEGRRVAAEPAIPCGTCERCREGNYNLCPTVRFAGHGSQDGALRECMAWPTELLQPVPPAMSDEAIALLEPLGIAIHAFDLGHVRLGASIAVVGCGPIGLLLLQVARAAGSGTVVAVEPLQHRRAAAAFYGLGPVIDPHDDLQAAIQAAGVPGGVDIAFEAAGTDEAVSTTMRLLRPGGRVVLAGIPAGDSTSFPASLARRRGLTIALVRRSRNTLPRAIRLVEQGLVELDPLVTHRFPLTEVAAAFTTAAARTGLKTVVLP